jgi:hypothetical protein
MPHAGVGHAQHWSEAYGQGHYGTCPYYRIFEYEWSSYILIWAAIKNVFLFASHPLSRLGQPL